MGTIGWVLLLVWAVGCGAEAPVGAPASPTVPGAAPSGAAAPAAPTPDGPPAPTRVWGGLRLGESTGEQVAAYVTAQGLTCESGPALARQSYQVRCKGDLPKGLLPDRVIGGQLTELLFSRPENGPLNTISTLRKYSLPDDAVADYNSALDTLNRTFGAPLRGGARAEVTVFDAKIGRVATVWRFADLEIRLTAMKASGAFIGVSEVWLVPGVEEQIEARPGVSGHGGQKAKNPHALPDPAAAPAAAPVP